MNREVEYLYRLDSREPFPEPVEQLETMYVHDDWTIHVRYLIGCAAVICAVLGGILLSTAYLLEVGFRGLR